MPPLLEELVVAGNLGAQDWKLAQTLGGHVHMAARRAGCWLKSRLCQAWLKGSWQLPAPRRFHAGGCSSPVAPAETLFTTRADGAVRLRLDPEGPGALAPITVHQLFQAAVERHGDRPALAYKRGQTWESLSYRQYQQQCRAAAKGFLKAMTSACLPAACPPPFTPAWVCSRVLTPSAASPTPPMHGDQQLRPVYRGYPKRSRVQRQRI
ncbi:hypothetical protein Y1Q_0008462 [Alligator mississippiensis]|uniref:AMP-dependent synthetase/ligase domain-containing protein n=1 Tax=Alligator mississippiensis TaxID=8496 RepID=A0A151NYH1_ALLMI|nr:hypothetical protein Y1Q_0008462 [Alligator mississippiensis]